MRLPEPARDDLLEFVGATPIADAQLSSMIDAMAEMRTPSDWCARNHPNSTISS